MWNIVGAVSHHVIEIFVHSFKRRKPTPGPQMLVGSILWSQLVRPHLNHIGDDVRIVFAFFLRGRLLMLKGIRRDVQQAETVTIQIYASFMKIC